MDLHIQSHLNDKGRVNLGSFYTPFRYVLLIKDWLIKHKIDSGNIVLDSSCGYGAFFELEQFLPNNQYIGNDVDSFAVREVSKIFPSVQTFNVNALSHVSRSQYHIDEKQSLVVVGNPPYNDVTSQINQRIKKSEFEIDSDIKTRDLGISFLLSYNKLQADYVAILHPLSYLIKRSNFSATKKFFGNYQLLEHIVFNSQEFANTSKMNGFPVLVGLYKRTPGEGLRYDDVCDMKFRTVEGDEFSLSSWDYVSDFIEKYPHKKRYAKEILFYTLRDINALKRSRTFLAERCANAVDVNPEKLPYYCYIDCFKRFADVPYYLGNFDIPFDSKTFPSIANEAVAVSAFYHPEVFGTAPQNTTAETRMKEYIQKLLEQ